MSVWGYVHVNVVAHGGHRPLGAEVSTGCELPAWMLGRELTSSAEAAGALSC